MPKQILRLAPDEDRPRLELEWGGYMRDFRVRLDGDQIEHITGGQRELIKGRDIALPDGSTLTIRLKNQGAIEELQVLRDGKPLPGSASDPVNQYSASIRIAFFWGMVSVIAWLVFRLGGGFNDLFASLTFHPSSLFTGLGFIVAAVALARQLKWIGFVAIALLIADTVLGIRHMVQSNAYVVFLSAAMMFLRVFVLVRLLPAVRR